MKNILDKVKGFSFKAVTAGIKKSGKADMAAIIADEPYATAACFTKNKVAAAPVKFSKAALKKSNGLSKAMLVNAGNANACTGKEGINNTNESARLLADLIGCKKHEVLVCSTGIIGEQLPMDKVRGGIEMIAKQKGSNGADFANAILTTDLVKKIASAKACGGLIAGACKGSGMIAPNMATMLGYIVTDIAITPAVLQKALTDAVNVSFNCVTVDGDTSTNDTVIVMSSGKAGNKIISKPNGKDYDEFAQALKDVCISLAEQIARDGEGATKLVKVVVNNAKSKKDAEKVAKTVAESPLVKTAMFGNDPNWGRIIAATGRSGCFMIEEKTDISLCGEMIYKKGTPAKFNAASLSKKMAKKTVEIIINLNCGAAGAIFYTCDFSYDYVKINADYHT